MKNIVFILIVLWVIVYACNTDPIGQQPIDNIPPGAVSNVQINNVPGGAILTYDLPPDEDLLYVKALFSRKEDNISEVRSSLYTDTLKVVGFGDTIERNIRIIAVDRSNNESQPVNVKISPLEAPIVSIGKTISIIPDFGGIRANWSNPENQEISIVILQEDHNKEYVPIETFYSSVEDGIGLVSGLDTLEYNFGIYAQDRWGNKTELDTFVLKPYYETLFEKTNFKELFLPGDKEANGSDYLRKFWDGIYNNYFHTKWRTGVWETNFTFDMGVVGRISRIKLFQRKQYGYQLGNARKFRIWGCTELDLSGNWDSWTLLMNCESIKPSGLPLGQVSNEDLELANNGETFFNDPANPPVRFLRWEILEAWDPSKDYFCGAEVEIYGDNRY